MVGNKISFNHLKKLNKNGESYQGYPLQKLTTFKIGGKAKYFLKIKTLENFIHVMLYIKEKSFPYFVIGNGSNILASSEGYNGIVIKLDGDFNQVLVKGNQMECGAGVLLSKAFVFARDNNLSGLEGSAGIPATIGGAVYMNAQSHDFEMSNIVDYVVAFNGEKITYFTRENCQFAYRDSIFQHGEYIILRVGLVLANADKFELFEKYKQVFMRRKDCQPYEYPNAGCVFKRKDPYVVSKMLDEMGAKNYSIGGARVSDKHANFIINPDNATSQDVWQLINKIKDEFYKKYSIELECEIKLLGEFDETTR